MAEPHHPQRVVLEKMVTDAGRLLDYAVSRGLLKEINIIPAIINIEAKLASEAMPEHSDIENFLIAYNRLSEITGGVSGDSLSPEAENDARRTKNIYTTTLIFLLVFLVPISTVTLTGKRLIEETLADIDYVCNNDENVKCSEQLYNISPSPKMQTASGSPSESPTKVQAAISGPSAPAPTVQAANGSPSNSSSGSGSSSAAKLLYDTDIRTYQIQNRMRKVAYTVISFSSPPRVPDDPIMTFHATRIYADNVKDEFGFWYDTLAGCLLPIAFAALGAVTFGLRDLRQRLEDRTWTKRPSLPFCG